MMMVIFSLRERTNSKRSIKSFLPEFVQCSAQDWHTLLILCVRDAMLCIAFLCANEIRPAREWRGRANEEIEVLIILCMCALCM